MRRADCKRREQSTFSMSHQNLCKKLLLTISVYKRGKQHEKLLFSSLHKSELDLRNNTPCPAALTLQPRALGLKCLAKQTNPSGENHLLIYSQRKEEGKDE